MHQFQAKFHLKLGQHLWRERMLEWQFFLQCSCAFPAWEHCQIIYDWVISGNSLKIYEKVFSSSLQALKSNPYWSVFVSFMLQSTKMFCKVELFQAEDGFSLHAVPFRQQLYSKVYLVLRLSQNLQQQGVPDHLVKRRHFDQLTSHICYSSFSFSLF